MRTIIRYLTCTNVSDFALIFSLFLSFSHSVEWILFAIAFQHFIMLNVCVCWIYLCGQRGSQRLFLAAKYWWSIDGEYFIGSDGDPMFYLAATECLCLLPFTTHTYTHNLLLWAPPTVYRYTDIVVVVVVAVEWRVMCKLAATIDRYR